MAASEEQPEMERMPADEPPNIDSVLDSASEANRAFLQMYATLKHTDAHRLTQTHTPNAHTHKRTQARKTSSHYMCQ